MIPVRPAPRPNGWLVWCGSRIGWWFPSPVVSLSCRPSSHLRSGVGQGVHLLGVSSERCGAVSGLSRVGKHKNNDNNTKKSKNNHRHHHHHHHHQSPNDRVFRPSQNSPLRKTTNTPPLRKQLLLLQNLSQHSTAEVCLRSGWSILCPSQTKLSPCGIC